MKSSGASSKAFGGVKRLAAIGACALVLTALVAGLSSCAAPGAKSTVTVKLESQAGTGYQWTCVASPDDVLKETGHETQADETQAGGTVTDTFTFAAQKASDDVSLTFLLERPWLDAEQDEDVQIAQYAFKVDDAKNVTLVSTDGTLENVPQPVIS